jgi:hypothetical protein
MKLAITLLSLSMAAAGALQTLHSECDAPTAAATSPERAGAGPQDADAMKRWIACCKVGKGHEWLRPFLGRWDAVLKMAFPGAPELKAKAEFSWLFEGRWLKSELKLQDAAAGAQMGMPPASMSILGYDNFKKKYVATSVTAGDTMMLHMEGMLDQSQKTLALYGPMDEPMTGEHDKPVKYVWRILGDDKMAFEVHDLAIGETNTKVIEVIYTREKP